MGDIIFLSIHAAKHRKMKELNMELHDPRMLKLVGYYTGITHSLNHKALYMKDIPYRREVPVYFNDEVQNYQIKVEEFEQMVEKDISEGLIPFWCGTTIGSTSLGCNDPIDQIAKICKKHRIFVNVDAAWAGAALIVPEIRAEIGKGLDLVDAIGINFGKWGMCGNNSAVLYVADKNAYRESLLGGATPQYLKNKYTDEYDIIDYKDWQIGLGRRFNSLRFWYMIRSLGVEGMRDNITEKIELAKEFETLLKQNPQFEMVCKRELSLVCFRLVKDKSGNVIPKDKVNDVNTKLLELIEATNKYHLVSSLIKDTIFIRFVICNHNTKSHHVRELWRLFEDNAAKVLEGL
jgi:glutamate/tyrosine decarboxylase-like PLP-dependent enzyme